MVEGEFRAGKLNGYGRKIDARTGACEVGFFQDGVPMGKYCQYAADGSYLLDEGIYEGYGPHGLVRKAKIEIATYMHKITKQKDKTVLTKNLYEQTEYQNRNLHSVSPPQPTTANTYSSY